MHARVAQSMGDSPLFSLKIIKVRRALEIGAQMLQVKGALKADPAERLRLIRSSEGLENLKPRLLRFDRDPARSVLIDDIDGGPSFLCAACSQEPLRDLYSDTRNSSRFLTLCNEGVDIPPEHRRSPPAPFERRCCDGTVKLTSRGTICSVLATCNRHYILWLDRLMQQSQLFLSRPLVAVPLAAKLLKITPKAVDLMLAQLGGALPRELTGRTRYRAWGIV
jgi:hypothetical protein